MMKRYTKMMIALLASAMLLASCGSVKKVEGIGDAVLTPVDSYYTKETREYTDEGIIEETVNTFTSDDGLCVIEQKPSYYDVTLDYETGDRASVGRAYAKTIKQVPGFMEMMEQYLFENIRMAYKGSYSEESVMQRTDILFGSMRPEYIEEISAYAEELSDGVHGVSEDQKMSYEEAILLQMIPDALRPTCCSALSLWGSKTETGDRITLRNLEWNLGSSNQMGQANAVIHMKNGDRTVHAISILGIFDIISAYNDDGVFAAILDVGSVQHEPFIAQGKKCYTMELRYALEEFATAKELGDFMVAESGNYTWCHNLIISDKDDSFCAEDCVSQVVEAGKGHSVLRDSNTPIFSGLDWDSEDSLCIVNSFATEGNQDGFTGSGSNIIRFAKYNEWVKAVDRFSPKDVKDLITQEQVDQYTVQNVHGDGSAQLILVDYHTGKVQVAFAGSEGVVDKPDFIEVGGF